MIVYIIENLANGKRYVGKTVKSFRHRWEQHVWHAQRNSYPNIHFLRAIRKYGPESFRVCAVLDCVSKAEMDNLERSVIAGLNAKDPAVGYNMTDGGEGTVGLKHSPEARARMSAAQRGNQKCLGRKHSPETIAKMSTTQTGKNHSAETKMKMRALKVGKKLSPEHCAALSAAHLRRHAQPTIK